MIERTLTGPLEMARGVIGRYPARGERYVFEFDRVAPRTIHMVGVRRPLLVRWLDRGELVAEETLRPWIGYGRFEADRVTEERPSVE